MKYLVMTFIIGLLVFSACDEDAFDEPEDDPDCGGEVYGAITSDVPDDPDNPVSTDLELMGTAYHSKGLAIRNIYVANINAERVSNSFNFRQWRVLIPHDVLLHLAREGDTEGQLRATIDLRAVDACGDEKLFNRCREEALEDGDCHSINITVGMPEEDDDIIDDDETDDDVTDDDVTTDDDVIDDDVIDDDVIDDDIVDDDSLDAF